ncbi:MAG: SpoIID/LytB domain-containing protein [Clostridia bacterium]|nr:SpoIID/LytB domain-containing protein [Clostridia bacterium]
MKMKKSVKALSLLLICTLIFSLAPSFEAQSVSSSSVRVGLCYSDTAVYSARFVSDSEINIYDASGTYIATFPAGSEGVATISGGAIKSEGIDTGETVSEETEDGETAVYNVYAGAFSTTSGAVTLSSNSVISFNGAQHRGSFELRDDGGKMTVINIVGMNDYLSSVLGKEMSASWPQEALKAQAVCARNYVLSASTKHSTKGFDVCATTDCQVYGGVASEDSRTRAAVEATQNVSVTYNGKVVPLYYFSCDGGYTEDSENVWANAEGYLRGKKDIYESEDYATYYNWKVTMTRSEIEETLKNKGHDIGTLLDITIDEVSDNNGVVAMTFVGTDDSYTATKTLTRTTLSLYSQAYTIEKLDGQDKVVDEDEAPTEEETEDEDFVFILTADGVEKTKKPVYRLTESGLERTDVIAPASPAEEYEEVEEEEEPEQELFETYVFNGHGWGHLVGMSQWGAYSMAKLGKTYKDILNFYFTDIKITEG